MATPHNNDAQGEVLRRSVLRTSRGLLTSDGAGVQLRRYIAIPELPQLDPFLLLDVFRSEDPDDYIAGFPPHPHRGFETVTYLLEGRMRHRDSAGHTGLLRAGGVQWMTAGRGIEHSEIPEQEDGLLHGFQLWVNLPAARKMVLPYYQEFDAEQIPVETRKGNIRVKVIAGTTSLGLQGAVRGVDADPLYLDVSLPGQGRFEELISGGYNAFLYVIEGNVALIDDTGHATPITDGTLAILGDGEELAISGQAEQSRFLLVAGRPFGEPVERSGPFVMNTREELMQAHRDYDAGRFGTVLENSRPQS